MTDQSRSQVVQSAVEIPVGERRLSGFLATPRNPQGIVLFAHGSGSGRNSPRNQFVAEVLQQAGIATLLFDLLDDEEAEVRAKVFDIEMLADRLKETAVWTRTQTVIEELPLGYFGASTGAAAALIAAARQGNAISSVVSRGGRPDLANKYLSRVLSPTLLIVGGNDDEVLELNQRAYNKLTCPKNLSIVPGATHLFVERGTLEQVAQIASEWFRQYLVVAIASESTSTT